MFVSIRKLIRDERLTGLEVGSPEYFALQKSIILERPALKACYDAWYGEMLADARSVTTQGIFLELGSGGGYLKEIEPSVVTSDVVEGVADRVVDGRHIPFPDQSIAALLLTHVLHHIPDINRFFEEALRTLVPGGVISLIEVAHTPFARFFFKHFHPEPYRDDVASWSFAQTDSMMDSNQALSWMVFVRDRGVFERDYPGLAVEAFNYLPAVSYLASGGVTGPCLVPGQLGRVAQSIDILAKPFLPLISLHWHIRIRKAV